MIEFFSVVAMVAAVMTAAVMPRRFFPAAAAAAILSTVVAAYAAGQWVNPLALLLGGPVFVALSGSMFAFLEGVSLQGILSTSSEEEKKKYQDRCFYYSRRLGVAGVLCLCVGWFPARNLHREREVAHVSALTTEDLRTEVLKEIEKAVKIRHERVESAHSGCDDGWSRTGIENLEARLAQATSCLEEMKGDPVLVSLEFANKSVLAMSETELEHLRSKMFEWARHSSPSFVVRDPLVWVSDLKITKGGV